MTALTALKGQARLALPPGVSRHAGLLTVLLAIGTVTALKSDAFLTGSNLLNVSQQIAVVAVLAAGLTLLMTAGGIDFSLGAIAALAHGVVAQLIVAGFNEWTAVGLALALGAAIGLVNGLVVTLLKVVPFVATLATSTILGGAALLVIDGKSISIGEHLVSLGFGEVAGAVPALVVIAMVVCVAAGLVLRWTAFGRNAFAIGGNENAARLAGIPVVRTKLLLYTLGGLLAALGGVMLVARLGAASPGTGGLHLELTVVAAVVIGGTALHGGSGTLVGTVLGVVLLGVVANSLNLLQINAHYQDVALGTVLLIAAITNHLRGGSH
ncbi:monosaccharide ABC transporter membrane protein, CUT2 family [Thermomonospora echinospora]|uniref:Monosaccharide ABC transporter membrane protein, CUT2 family n=1 Tax=Thermomonospora echinospora TaxID=1992 RepID=A0A1H6DQX8_9ACTN|nr:ABC transporter permease [Thermomonospora echinospora]SEG87817.1 monosaccharide ABC transporter membrane protein, CUT2 family [Thermomonospora echinospora]